MRPDFKSIKTVKILLDIFRVLSYTYKVANTNAAMAQMVERVLGKDEVTGSIPVSSSMRKAIAKSNCFFQLYSPYSE